MVKKAFRYDCIDELWTRSILIFVFSENGFSLELNSILFYKLRLSLQVKNICSSKGGFNTGWGKSHTSVIKSENLTTKTIISIIFLVMKMVTLTHLLHFNEIKNFSSRYFVYFILTPLHTYMQRGVLSLIKRKKNQCYHS